MDKVLFKESSRIAKEVYERGCENYLELFCKKHEYTYEPYSWVGGDIGGVASVGDYFVDMKTLRTDIDEDAPEGEFIKWYDYCIAANEFGLTMPNFHSWIHGCPRTSEETFARFRSMRNQLFELVEEEKKRNS